MCDCFFRKDAGEVISSDFFIFIIILPAMAYATCYRFTLAAMTYITIKAVTAKGQVQMIRDND